MEATRRVKRADLVGRCFEQNSEGTIYLSRISAIALRLAPQPRFVEICTRLRVHAIAFVPKHRCFYAKPIVDGTGRGRHRKFILLPVPTQKHHTLLGDGVMLLTIGRACGRPDR